MRLKTGLKVVYNDDKSDNYCNNQSDEYNIWTITRSKEERLYTYDEAVDMTGHGLYSIGLLLASCSAICGGTLDLFAFPVITSASACDLQLTPREEKILISLPFIGAVISSYPWGYISDTKGRRASMLIGMWVSFTASCLAAFSPHWILLGVLKFISGAFSSCAVSATYTLIGESCGTKVKAVYFFLLNSILHLAFPLQMSLHYFSLTLDFSINLGFIEFIPWRLLTIALALPLGICALLLHFHYESPKFLVNAEREREAIEILQKIWMRNRGIGQYPVKKLVIIEDGNSKPSNVNFLQSLWHQIKPLFVIPLLFRTLQLYFLVIVIYGTIGGLLSWFPYLANAFISGSLSAQSSTEGLCNMITEYHRMSTDVDRNVTCVPKTDPIVVWASLIQGFCLFIINIAISVAASRRKLILFIVFFVPGLAALGCAFITNNVASLISYFTIFLTVIAIGIVNSYFVDLYPTSFRGMVSSLSMVSGRISNLASVNFIGHRVMDHCDSTFYIVAIILFSGVLITCFLPPDNPKNNNNNMI